MATKIVVKMRKRKDTLGYQLDIHNKKGNRIGIIYIEDWHNIKAESVESEDWEQFNVHVHNLQGNLKVQKGTKENHVAVYPN